MLPLRVTREGRGMTQDPTRTDPDKYRTVFENDQVRVLVYRDHPGGNSQPHGHPDSVMVTFSSFQRTLYGNDQTRHATMEPGQVHWLPGAVPRR